MMHCASWVACSLFDAFWVAFSVRRWQRVKLDALILAADVLQEAQQRLATQARRAQRQQPPTGEADASAAALASAQRDLEQAGLLS
jgi:hypothetical protein